MRNVKSSGSPKVEAKRTTANLPSPTPGSLETRYVGLAQMQPAQEPLAPGVGRDVDGAGGWREGRDIDGPGVCCVGQTGLEAQLCFAFSVEAAGLTLARACLGVSSSTDLNSLFCRHQI